MAIYLYSAVWLIPTLTLLGIALGGVYTWLSPLIIFGVIPVLEHRFKGNGHNVNAGLENQREESRYAQLLLISLLPFQLLCVLGLAWRTQDLSMWELTGLVIGVGTVQGALGINGAHELGHRKEPTSKRLAKLMLSLAMYPHFTSEHNRGHHLRVGTPEDPATAKRGQNVYAFWRQSLVGGIASAWRFERSRLQKRRKKIISLHNQILKQVSIFAVFLIGIGLGFGPLALVCILASCVIGVLLLETVNYVQHYGLMREQLSDGSYERVGAQHTWVSNHPLSRALLFELPRHSDHHIHAGRHFSNLRHIEGSPLLPTGYPALILLSLLPPFFVSVMETQLASFAETQDRACATWPMETSVDDSE